MVDPVNKPSLKGEAGVVENPLVTAKEVMEMIHDFLFHFFGCSDCRYELWRPFK